MDKLKNVITGNIEEYSLDSPILQVLNTKQSDLLKNKYKEAPPSKVILVSTVLETNNIEHITKICYMYKTDKNVQKYISYLLDTCEKWKFINIFNSINESTMLYFNEVDMEDFVCDYMNTAYLFDFSKLKDASDNVETFNQFIFNDIDRGEIKLTTSTPSPSKTSVGPSSNDGNLVLLEAIDNYAPIIGYVSNPSEYDLVLYESVNINPFKLGRKIKINKREYVYKSCMHSGILYKYESDHAYMSLFIKVNGNCWSALFANNKENRIKIYNPLYTSSSTINNIVNISSFEVYDGHKWVPFESKGAPPKLKYSYRNNTSTNILVSNINLKHIHIGPCMITSLFISPMNTRNILFDYCRFSVKNFVYNEKCYKLLRRIYNIPAEFNIDTNNVSIYDLVFKYPLKEFIKVNRQFICDTKSSIDDSYVEYVPTWDYQQVYF